MYTKETTMHTYKASLTDYWHAQTEEAVGEQLPKRFTVELTEDQLRQVKGRELFPITDIGPLDEMVKANFGSNELPNEWMIPLAGINRYSLIEVR